MKWHRSIFLGFLIMIPVLLLTNTVVAEDEITYTGISAKKARFRMSGRTLFLKPGESGPDGLKLISAEESQAVVSRDGKVYSYKKGSSKPQVLATKIVLNRGRDGAFTTKGSINGMPFMFIVDTGATFVTMNSRDARKLKLKYKQGKKIEVSTASKRDSAYLIEVDNIRIGGLYANKVVVAVIDGKFPEIVLLGNSFLHKLNILQMGNNLVITSK